MITKILKAPQAVIGLILIAVVLITAMFAPVLAPNDPEAVNVMLKFGEASKEFPMGNDALGRCVLSRLLYGARYA